VRTGIELEYRIAGQSFVARQQPRDKCGQRLVRPRITVTPLQLAVAYGAIANGGKMMKPYIVDSIVHPDGTTIKTQPRTVRQVIPIKPPGFDRHACLGGQNGEGTEPASPLLGRRENRHRADRQKTTARDTSPTFMRRSLFAGFAPVSDPRFVMVVRIDRPRM